MPPDGKAFYHCRFRYHIRENKYDGNRFFISGEFEKVSPPSSYLQHLLTRSGVPQEVLSEFTGKDLTA